jgi:hypothetical protein
MHILGATSTMNFLLFKIHCALAVIPAHAGIAPHTSAKQISGVPAFAGMTAAL